MGKNKKDKRRGSGVPVGVPVQPATADQIAELEQLYAQIPDVNCRGVCQAACGPIGMGDAEHARLSRPGLPVIPRSDRTPAEHIPASCPALTALGRCGVYQIRPMVCRIWGAVRSMRCPFGCVPAGGWLAEVDGQILLMRSLMVGASVTEQAAYRRIIERLETNEEAARAMSAWTLSQGNSGISPQVQAEIARELGRIVGGGPAGLATNELAVLAAEVLAETAGHRRR